MSGLTRVETADGVALALRRFAPPSGRSGRGAALLTHAMMVDSAYLRGGRRQRDGGGFAAALAATGLDVFVLDWRGHGDSKPPRAGRDPWCFDDYVERDLPAALAAVERASGCGAGRVAILGHSLGGLVALAGLGTGTIAAARLVLAATSVWLPGRRGPRHRRALMALFDRAARRLGRAPIRALRLGSEDEPAGYVAQLAGWARTGRWTRRDGLDYLARLAVVDVPTWAVVGAGDRLCRAADARALAARVPRAAGPRVVGVASGDALDADHFTLFNRPALAPVWTEIAGRLSSPP